MGIPLREGHIGGEEQEVHHIRGWGLEHGYGGLAIAGYGYGGEGGAVFVAETCEHWCIGLGWSGLKGVEVPYGREECQRTIEVVADDCSDV